MQKAMEKEREIGMGEMCREEGAKFTVSNIHTPIISFYFLFFFYFIYIKKNNNNNNKGM